jgi:hypothetical protein
LAKRNHPYLGGDLDHTGPYLNNSRRNPPLAPHLADNRKSITLETKRDILRETCNAQKPTSIGRLAGNLEQLIAAVAVVISGKSSRVGRRLAKVIPQKITNRPRTEHILQR